VVPLEQPKPLGNGLSSYTEVLNKLAAHAWVLIGVCGPEQDDIQLSWEEWELGSRGSGYHLLEREGIPKADDEPVCSIGLI
jgi:hypothetical protein